MSTNQSKQSSLIKYEWMFVALAFIFGLMFVYQNPPFHSNDEDRHFLKAYNVAHNGFYDELSPDSTMIGGLLPKNLYTVVNQFQGFPYQNGKKMSQKMVDDLSKVPLNKKDSEFKHNRSYSTPFWAYLPHAISIKLSGNANPVNLGYAARIGGLMFYILCMFFIIRNTPVFKSIFMLFGLMPMTLYQASSVTYDTLLIVCTFAVLSMFLRYSLVDNVKFGFKQLIYLFILVFLIRTTKQGYFFLPFIMLLLPRNKLSSNLMYILILAVCILGFFSLDLLNSTFNGELSSGLKKGYAFQKDFKFGLAERQSEMLGNITGTLGTLYQNILHFRQDWLSGILGKFGYSYSKMPQIFYQLNGLVLIAVASLAGKSKYPINNTTKYIVSALGLLSCGIIIAGFYGFSPIGANMIFGLQGRYFLPMIPFVLLMFYNTKIEFAYWEKWGPLILGIYCFLMLGYTYGQMKVLFYAF
ncbi:DUF2142 domain-containing protein [Candidatus Kapabacteria bacterium]|nr:DUF2142 domain-containing protein [Candidatus Kapabacteria bacterium]